MRWKKLGLVYGPDGRMPWAKSHAMIPTPMRFGDDVVRVFITCLDANGIGRPGYVDVSSADPTRVIGIASEPLLDIGRPGTFDENGLLTCSVVDLGDGRMFLYYAGFELGTRIRYRLLTGLAISEDGGKTFRRHSPTPVLERTATECYFRGGPFCTFTAQRFRLWYVGGSEWLDVGGKSMPVYDIRYAESADGVHWPTAGEVKISVADADEYGFGRPSVIAKPGGGFRMFYSTRRRSLGAYRLGYAESTDGQTWQRMDARLGIDVSPGQFDSDAIMYAAPIMIGDKLYLFYNGNEFGRDGFAVAVLSEG